MILSACGGGGSSDIDQAPSTRVLSNDVSPNGTLGDVNVQKIKLTAQSGMTSGMAISWSDNTTSRLDTTFAVATGDAKKGDTAEIHMIVDGETFEFGAIERDANGYGYRAENNPDFVREEDPYIELWSQWGLLDNMLDENNAEYSQIWKYYVGTLDDSIPSKTGFAVVGTQTVMSDVANSSTANYSGYARMQVVGAENYEGWSGELQLRGDIGLTMDFEQSTIMGDIADLETRYPDTEWSPISGAFDLSKASVNTNGEFKGTMSADAGLKTRLGLGSTDKGAYAGALFGPNADEVSGTLSMASDAKTVFGYFKTYQQE